MSGTEDGERSLGVGTDDDDDDGGGVDDGYDGDDDGDGDDDNYCFGIGYFIIQHIPSLQIQFHNPGLTSRTL